VRVLEEGYCPPIFFWLSTATTPHASSQQTGTPGQVRQLCARHCCRHLHHSPLPVWRLPRQPSPMGHAGLQGHNKPTHFHVLEEKRASVRTAFSCWPTGCATCTAAVAGGLVPPVVVWAGS